MSNIQAQTGAQTGAQNYAPTLPAYIIAPLVQMALTEDLGRAGDITGKGVVPDHATMAVAMVSREVGCICGLDMARAVFLAVDPKLEITLNMKDGTSVKKGDTVMTIKGLAQSVLAAERVALNFVGHLSGIATMTQTMVRAVGNHKTRIAATRKTTPGLRAIEKYAVEVGGGIPHRYALDDAVMIKDNHIASVGGDVRLALRRAKENIGHTVKIEIEVDTLEQLDAVLAEGGADIIMLDNMTNENMISAVQKIAGVAVVEASGGVTLARIPEMAATGVDVISVGALTHSVQNFDVGLDSLAA